MAKGCISGRAQPPYPSRINSTPDESAGRAFELYDRRCSIDGWDLDDGVETESALVEERIGRRARRQALRR